MTRVHWLLISQSEHLGPIRLEAKVDADVDFSRLSGQVQQGVAS